MKMKPIVIMAAMALSFNVTAQSLPEGIKMYKYERYQSAKQQLAPMAANDAMASYYLGLAELESGNVDQAAAIFSKYPESYANISGMARVSFARGKSEEGNQVAQGLAAKAKKKDWEQLKYAADAVNYGKGGNIQNAIEWYTTALQRNPDNAEILIGLGDAYQKTQGGGGQAMSSYEKVTAKDANNSLAFSRIGKLWYDARNYEDALKNFQKAKDTDPANPLPYNDLALAYFYSGKYDLAKQNIEKYLELSDKNDEDMIRYATILYLAKDYANAIKISEELINKGVKKPALYGILGFSQAESKDSLTLVKAVENARVYMTTQETEKIGYKDYINMGKIFLANNMPDSANAYFDKAIAKADASIDKADVYEEIAKGFTALKTTEAYAKGAEWYARIVREKAAPSATDYYYWGFWNLYGHKYDTAAIAFEMMETKFPDQPSATYWRGRTAAAIDNEAKTGIGVQHYLKWLSVEKTGYERKKADLMYAYQYLAYYYYNQNDWKNVDIYLNKIKELEPENDFVKQIEKARPKAK